jgi:hypothetical protein
VPQPEHWKTAWAESTSVVSYLKQETLAKEKGESREGICIRKQRAKQVTIMSEVAKRKARKRLREATSICLSMDDVKARKIMRFRCDTPHEPYHAGGILGVFDGSYVSLDEITEDHGKIAVAKMESFLREYFTPLGRDFDAAGYSHFCTCVHTLVADGATAARKILFLAFFALFPNLSQAIRDAAHAIRIAVSPLHFDALFGAVWKEIADRRHSLLADVMNSPKNQKILEMIQTDCLKIPSDARPLTVVLKHFGFAKQRMDSSVNPIAKVAMLLLVVCTMLALRASDERNKTDMRKNARHLLEQFKAPFCEALGASADWGILYEAFLRKFDQRDHDISCTCREVAEYLSLLDACFRKGGIFVHRDSEAAMGSAAPPAGALKPRRFISQIVRNQIHTQAVFRCGQSPTLVLGRCTSSERRELAQRMHVVCDTTEARLKAEFAEKGLQQSTACFDITMLRDAWAEGAAPLLKNKLRNMARLLSRGWGANPSRFVTEWEELVPPILERACALQYRVDEVGKADNRPV